MKLINLKEEQKYIPIIAAWFHEEWSYFNPTRTYEILFNHIDTVINNEKANQIFICIKEDVLVSSISLRKEEVPTSLDYEPWLSSLVVDKNYRNSGVGLKTILLFEQYCSNNSIESLYLFTEKKHLENWYKKQGWIFKEKTIFKKHQGSILKKSLKKTY